MEYDVGIKTADGKWHFSLLKGGQGVQPEVSTAPQKQPQPPQPHDRENNKDEPQPSEHNDDNNNNKPESPTAAETLAALANATGPISLPVPDAALELLAALAVGEPMAPPAIPTNATKTATTNDDAGGTTAETSPAAEADSASNNDTSLPEPSKDPTNPNNVGDETITSSSRNLETTHGDDKSGGHALENGGKNGEDCKEKETTTSQPPRQDSPKPSPTKNHVEANAYYCNNNKVVVQMAMKRRIRDGALLAAQVDTTLSTVEILIPSEAIPLLIHLALGVQFCFAKDRGFEDPLRSADDRTDHNDASAREFYSGNSRLNSSSRDMNVVNENLSEDAAEEQGEKVGKDKAGEEYEKVATNGEVSAAPTVDTSSYDAQAKEPKESEAGNGEITANEYAALSESTSGDASSVEETEVKLSDAVRYVLESGGVDNSSIRGDLLSALEETVVEDPADSDTLDGSTVSPLQSAEESKGFAKSFSSLFSRRSVILQASSEATKAFTAMEAALASATGSKPLTPTGAENEKAVTGGSQPDRAVIMLPNGLVIHEKLSFSVSVDRATIRGVYPSREVKSPVDDNATFPPGAAAEPRADEQNLDGNDFIQVDSRGAVVELIWPKSDLKKGGYAQASVSYMSVQERHGKRIRTLLSGGIKDDPLARPVEKSAKPPAEVAQEEAFPMFEDRAIRDDPLDLRRSFPAQAMGLMATIDCQTRATSPSKAAKQLSLLPTTITMSKDSDDSTSLAHDAPQDDAQPDDSPKENTDEKDEQEEVVDVIVVTNDLGVDQINVVLDCDCWCRALRFFLNEAGGGFDGRWISGDWTDLLTIDMLVHPNSPMELEDHLQPMQKFYLDENHFISSDLMHVNARFCGCELRIPAAIEENVRSCDIVVIVDETFMTVSSDLPREFLSGGIGSTFCQRSEPSDASQIVAFPNDATDASIELQKSEDPSRRQSFMMMANTDQIVKSKSTFRLEVKLRGMTTQIIPIVPFFVGSKPQQLCSPTDMTIRFSFEGEPPETEESNLIKMAFSSAIVIDHIETNLDLDLVAGAVSTMLHHFQVVREAVERAQELIPMQVLTEDDPSVSNNEREDDLSSTASARIQKSLRGRRVLVRRQLHRSRETGGLRLLCFLQLSNYGFTLWRHNVAVHRPARSVEATSGLVDRKKLHIPLLKLLSFVTKNVEVGIEISFPDDERRIVSKCAVEEVRLRFCILDSDANLERGGVDLAVSVSAPPNGKGYGAEEEEVPITEEEQGDPEENGNACEMVDLFHFGRCVPIRQPTKDCDENAIKRERAILLRYEEYYGGFRSRSFAAEIGTGGTSNLCIDQFESIFLLVLDALLMPTWSKSGSFPLVEKRRFPERSVGALLHSLLPGNGGRFRFWLFLRRIITLLLPSDLRLLLLRIQLAEMLVTIPTVEGQHALNLLPQGCDLMVRHLELLTWYISPEQDFHNSILDVVAATTGSKSWSDLVSTESAGINHRLNSKQSFLVNVKSEMRPIEVLPEFQVALHYLQAKLSTSVENTLSLCDTEQLRECFRFLRSFVLRCVDIFFHLKRRLAFLRRREPAEEEKQQGGSENDVYQPISAACADMEKSVRAAKDFVLLMCRHFDGNLRDYKDVLRQKDEEVERLQKLVFLKEKERVAAVAMVSSPIAGWLRVGGTHQSGQRVATTSTLWRYWTVLRRDVLILYNGPGKYKPVDFVSLSGARLRLLAGGRSKWDLKRSFGIVEFEGKTRFFVAGSDEEYNAWTREIEKVTSFHNTADKETKVVATVEVENELAPDRDDEESVGVDGATPRMADSVVSEGEPITDRPPNPGLRSKLAGIGSSLRKTKQDTPPKRSANESTATPSAVDLSATTASQQPDTSEASENSDATPTTSVAQDAASNRRPNLTGKVAGVGKATGRWGSALIAATRQKGREVAERTRRASNTAAPNRDEILSASGHNTLHVISEREDKNWTCPKCTFVNSSKESDIDLLICAMCEIPSDPGDVEFDRPPPVMLSETATMPNETEGSESAIQADAVEEANRDRLDSGDSDQGIFRRSQSTPMEARAQLNSVDSDAESLRRIQSSGSFGASIEDDETSVISDLAMDEMSEAARSGGRRASRNRLGGLGATLGGRRTRQNRPPEPEKKGWFARLGSNVSNNQDDTDTFQKSQAALKLNNVRIDPSIDFVCDGVPSVNAPLMKLDGHYFAVVTEAVAAARRRIQASPAEAMSKDGDVLKDGDVSSAASLPQHATGSVTGHADNETAGFDSAEHLFSIQIFGGALDDGSRQPQIEVLRSAYEIVGFHATISEIVADLMHHPLFHGKSLDRTSTGEMTSGLQNALGISPLDEVRISGAFLAGLVDARSSPIPVEVPAARRAEVVMDFLNSVLGCPLSNVGHFALKDFLSVQALSSRETWSADEDADDDDCREVTELETSTIGETNPKQKVMLGDITGNELMELSSKCMGELVVAEQNGRLATNLLGTVHTRNEFFYLAEPSHLEPLLPNHVTENLQEAMHAALMKVMAERDEAHAQLVSASVLHTHTVEQEKKKVEILKTKLDGANRQLSTRVGAGLFVDKKKKTQEEKEERERLEKLYLAVQQNSDSEIVALCEQLSGEISARTQAALEVIRLKESRTIERQHEAAEKQALREELTRLKERLAIEERKAQEAKQNAARWKGYYDRARSSDASSSATSTP